MIQKWLLFSILCLIVSCSGNSAPPRWMDLHDAMEEVKDNIKPVKKASKSKWKSYPVKEAQALASIFKAMDQIDEVKKQNGEFNNLLQNTQKLSLDFARSIGAENKDNAAINKAFKAMGRSCKACHDKFKEDD